MVTFLIDEDIIGNCTTNQQIELLTERTISLLPSQEKTSLQHFGYEQDPPRALQLINIRIPRDSIIEWKWASQTSLISSKPCLLYRCRSLATDSNETESELCLYLPYMSLLLSSFKLYFTSHSSTNSQLLDRNHWLTRMTLKTRNMKILHPIQNTNIIPIRLELGTLTFTSVNSTLFLGPGPMY